MRCRAIIGALALCMLPACSPDTDPCAPLTVNVSDLLPNQQSDAMIAVERWNTAAGYDVLAFTFASSDGPDLRITRKVPPHGSPIFVTGNQIEIGKASPGPCAIEQKLGLALGIPLDNIEGSVMHPAPYPNCDILPQHVAMLRAKAGGACEPVGGWAKPHALIDASVPVSVVCESVGDGDGGSQIPCGAMDKRGAL